MAGVPLPSRIGWGEREGKGSLGNVALRRLCDCGLVMSLHMALVAGARSLLGGGGGSSNQLVVGEGGLPHPSWGVGPSVTCQVSGCFKNTRGVSCSMTCYDLVPITKPKQRSRTFFLVGGVKKCRPPLLFVPLQLPSVTLQMLTRIHQLPSMTLQPPSPCAPK